MSSSPRQSRSILKWVPFLLVLSLVSCEGNPYEVRSGQARVEFLLVGADGNPVEAMVDAISRGIGNRGETYSVRAVGGVAQFFLIPGRYAFRVDGLGFVDGNDVVVDYESTASSIELEPGSELSREVQFGGLRVYLRDSVTGAPIPITAHDDWPELLPSGGQLSDGVPQVDGSRLFRALPVGTYKCVYAPPSDGVHVSTWFPSATRVEDAGGIEIVRNRIQDVTVDVIRGGFLSVELESPLPPDYELSYRVTVTEVAGPDPVGTGSSISLGPLPPGRPVSATVEFHWSSVEGGEGELTFPVSPVVLDPEETQTTRVSFHGIHAIDPTCSESCGRRFRARSELAGESLECKSTASSVGGAWLLFPDEEDRDVWLDNYPSGTFSLRTYWPDHLDEDEAESLFLAAGQVREIEFPAIPESYVRGRVVDTDGGPLPLSVLSRLTVRFTPLPPYLGSVAYLEDDGGFVVAGLPPGEYRISAQPGSATDYLETWWGDSLTEDGASVLEIDTGDDPVGLRIQLQRR